MSKSAFTETGVRKVFVLEGSASLDTAPIAAASHIDVTMTVTGASVLDRVVLGLPTAPTAGVAFMAWVSAANTVTVRFFNYTAAAIDPPAATFSVSVIKA